MKKIIFGAGRNGRKLLSHIEKKDVYCFVDNDSNKWGTECEQIPIISFDEMRALAFDKIIILSVDSDEMSFQLKKANLQYLTYKEYLNSYEYVTQLDKRLLNQHKNIPLAEYQKEKIDNWYRKTFKSEQNKWIVEMFKKGCIDKVIEYQNKGYTGKFYSDEYFENRPGMRLAANIVLTFKEPIKVCDMGCGHGELLKVLSQRGVSCFGIDTSIDRVSAVKELGISCECATIDNTNFENEFFDVVICQECLEHVENVFSVVAEIKRILKKAGMVIITVPYGEMCDCDNHVRQFYEGDLFNLFSNEDFTDIKIMKIPYLNETMDDNLFLTAYKG